MPVYLVVSDIHSNYPAFESVLNSAPEFDSIICLGDMLGLCGFSDKVVSELQERDTEIVLKGNHDISLLEWGEGHVNSESLSQYEYDSTHSQLTTEQKDWIKNKKTYATNEKQKILCSHAYPSKEQSSGTEPGNAGLSKRNFTHYASTVPDNKEIVLCGHTHTQASLYCGRFGHEVTIANPGSVGMNIEDNPEYAIVDTQQEPGERVHLYSTNYDEAEVKQRVKQLDTPIKWWK